MVCRVELEQLLWKCFGTQRHRKVEKIRVVYSKLNCERWFLPEFQIKNNNFQKKMTRRKTRTDLKRAREKACFDRNNAVLRPCAQQSRQNRAGYPQQNPEPAEILFTILPATPQVINPRHRGAIGSIGFNSRNLSLRFASNTDVPQPQVQVLCDNRYIGIPIVKESFVAKQGLATWNGPGVLVKMRNEEVLKFEKFVLLTAAHQGVGYFGEVVVAKDEAPFYEINGWKSQFGGVAPDLVFTKSFLNSDNKIVPNKA